MVGDIMMIQDDDWESSQRRQKHVMMIIIWVSDGPLPTYARSALPIELFLLYIYVCAYLVELMMRDQAQWLVNDKNKRLCRPSLFSWWLYYIIASDQSSALGGSSSGYSISSDSARPTQLGGAVGRQRTGLPRSIGLRLRCVGGCVNPCPFFERLS